MAVYTEVSDDELTAFIAGHGLGELRSFKGIAEGVENTNYMVETALPSEGQGSACEGASAGSGIDAAAGAATRRFILTIYEKRVRREDLPFFLGLMEHLAAKGIACPVPVRDREGAQVVDLAGRPAAIVTFLDGLSVRRCEPRHCELVGEALARFHLAGLDYPIRRANALGPEGWRPLFDHFAGRANEVQTGLGEAIESELSELLPRWPTDLPRGVIHADLFPDNVFFLGGRLSGIIDFYFACNDWLAYDIAICLNAWCFEPDFSFNVTKSRALLAGYESVRPLQAGERAAMPLLARGAALRFLLTRSHDWLMTPKTALVAPHDPGDYLRRLRFHQRVSSAGAYGLEG